MIYDTQIETDDVQRLRIVPKGQEPPLRNAPVPCVGDHLYASRQVTCYVCNGRGTIRFKIFKLLRECLTCKGVGSYQRKLSLGIVRSAELNSIEETDDN